MGKTVIHPTAIIHSTAELGSGTIVGPYCVIGEKVTLGEGCILDPHVHIKRCVKTGNQNRFHSGSAIGDDPQDLKYKDAETWLILGDNNVIRENVTLHRSNKPEEHTTIGSENYFMAGSHVGHNSQIGDKVILANGALIGGHVTIGDRVFISGNCLVHQFARIGKLALMQGGAGISKDLPPFTIARGNNGICGLNVVGLRRASISSEERLDLKRLYHLLFREGQKMSDAVAAARMQFTSPGSTELIDFVASSTRGVCRDTGSDPAD